MAIEGKISLAIEDTFSIWDCLITNPPCPEDRCGSSWLSVFLFLLLLLLLLIIIIIIIIDIVNNVVVVIVVVLLLQSYHLPTYPLPLLTPSCLCITKILF